jgi:flagellar motor switch protein FliN/FliY
LLVNDSVIARGDVVVVEGNYGVRITEIVSRRERMRSVL